MSWRAFLLALVLLLAQPWTSRAQFTYTTNFGSLTIESYDCSGSEVVIPAEVGGMPVVSIGGNAFFRCSSVTSVTIPFGVTNIGGGAFWWCSRLTNVVIPQSVRGIQSSAFYGCTNLTAITIPDGVQAIGQSAFYRCTGLTNVVIPGSVNTIGEAPFQGCTNLMAITVDPPTGPYSSMNGVLFQSGTLVQFPGGRAGHYAIPTTSIRASAFRECSRLVSVTIRDGTVTIPAAAFMECTGLSTVDLPSTVTDIGALAFWGCTNLAFVTVPPNLATIQGFAFHACASLTSFSIPRSVRTIGEGAFESCTSLAAISVSPSNTYFSSLDGVLFDKQGTTLIQFPGGRTGHYAIPLGVTNSWYRSFGGCTNINSVSIPSTLPRITSVMFADCTGLTNVSIPSSVTAIEPAAFRGCTSLVEINLPDGVENIYDYAFEWCTGLKTVLIPKSVNYLGIGIVRGCTNLSAIHVDPLNTRYSSLEGVLFDKERTWVYQCPGGKGGEFAIPNGVLGIGGTAFWICVNLTNVSLPMSITNIQRGAFRDSTGLQAIHVDPLNSRYSSREGVLFDKNQTTLIQCPGGKAGEFALPQSVALIESSAFQRCHVLTKVTIPSAVRSIGASAFSDCTNLTEVLLSTGLTNLVDQVFRGCSSLREVKIPRSIKKLGEDTFSGCANLQGVYFEGNAPVSDGGVFDGIEGGTVFHLMGTSGWGPTFTGLPTAIWQPKILTGDPSFGVQTNQFGFTISWASGQAVVVQATTTLTGQSWLPISTNTLPDGTAYFSDAGWTNHQARFYRLYGQ